VSDPLNEVGPKTFQCNFPPGPSTRELLGLAANGLSTLVHKEKGRALWHILGQPLPTPSDEAGLWFQAVAAYEMGKLKDSVTLQVVAVDQGAAGVRLVASFRNSTTWGMPYGEYFVGLAMQAMDRFVQSRFPDNTGWYMINGGWMKGHQFAARLGAPPSPLPPPPPPAPAAEAGPDLLAPDNLRMFGAAVAGIALADLLGLVRNTLLAEWDMQSPATEEVDHVEVHVCQGDRRYGRGQEMRVAIHVFRRGDQVNLAVGFGDGDRWCSNDASAVVQRALLQINAALQVRFPAKALHRLQPG
jgi:hypothetical protein